MQHSHLQYAQRQEQILEILRKDMTIRGSHLSELLGASEMMVNYEALQKVAYFNSI